MSDLFQEPADATPLDCELPKTCCTAWIATRADLNEAEKENILKASAWARQNLAPRKSTTASLRAMFATFMQGCSERSGLERNIPAKPAEHSALLLILSPHPCQRSQPNAQKPRMYFRAIPASVRELGRTPEWVAGRQGSNLQFPISVEGDRFEIDRPEPTLNRGNFGIVLPEMVRRLWRKMRSPEPCASN